MADFDIALTRTLKFEGIYSSGNSQDPGGETVYGIARSKNPQWDGWALVDQLKNRADWPDKASQIIGGTQEVLRSAAAFYASNYWRPIHGDELTDQTLANLLFDCSVNMGVGMATLHLQTALNALNRNGDIYPDIPEDGNLGPLTMSAIQKLNDSRLLAKGLAIVMGAFYFKIMRADPRMEHYARGWLSRIDLT